MNTKSKTNFLLKSMMSIKFILCIFFLGSSVFASSGEDSFLADPVVSEKKDISVFFSRLSERFQGIFQEIVDLSSESSSISSSFVQEKNDSLIDVDGHLYAPEIFALADKGVIDAHRQKFYPDNYLRRYELVIMLVNYRLIQEKKQLTPVVFPLRGWFYDVAQNTSYAPYVAYAEQQGWIDSFITQQEEKKFFSPNQFLSKEEVCSLLKLDPLHTFCSKEKITRAEFSAVLLRGFTTFALGEVQLGVSSPVSEQDSGMQIFGQVKRMFSLVRDS